MWLLVDDYLRTLALLLALLFAPPLVLGLAAGAWRRAPGFRKARWPGFAWYLLVELAVLVDRGYPFFWGNLADMLFPVRRHAVNLAAGLLLGALSFWEAGRIAERGHRLAGRVLGFAKELPPRAPSGDGRTGDTA